MEVADYPPLLIFLARAEVAAEAQTPPQHPVEMAAMAETTAGPAVAAAPGMLISTPSDPARAEMARMVLWL